MFYRVIFWLHIKLCYFKTFRENFDLKITITIILKIVNFLHVTFNLCTGRYQPYKKPNDSPTYINLNSDHPHNNMKALPDSISKRISNISSDKATFNNAAPFYNHLLSASGYKENLTYQKDLPPSIKVKPRKIIWLNPPYSVNVETNFDREILTQTLLTERYFFFFFFLSGFSFANIHDSRDSRGRGRVSI